MDKKTLLWVLLLSLSLIGFEKTAYPAKKHHQAFNKNDTIPKGRAVVYVYSLASAYKIWIDSMENKQKVRVKECIAFYVQPGSYSISAKSSDDITKEIILTKVDAGKKYFISVEVGEIVHHQFTGQYDTYTHQWKTYTLDWKVPALKSKPYEQALRELDNYEISATIYR
ncbi:MAG: hypothetical protein WCK92_08090 [Bacteroidota bacterium]